MIRFALALALLVRPALAEDTADFDPKRFFGHEAKILGLVGVKDVLRQIPRLEYHTAPRENLEHVDIATFGEAKETIDMAAYVLTDWAIMDALRAAAKRGVAVRIVLDASQVKPGNRAGPFLALLAEPNVAVRIKPSEPDIMHLKAYSIDGRLLRTGSANFSASGLKRQNNDLLLTNEKAIVDAFDKTFETIWDAAQGADTVREAAQPPEPRERRSR